MIFTRKNKFKVILGSLIFTSFCLLWEHLNGGVITHHLLAREDLPGISNWWGLLTITSLTWISFYQIHKRQRQNPELEKTIISRFFAAFVFGLIASILWELNLDEILPFYILLPLPIAFLIPLHRQEYLLGFVLGMLFTFGGILPILVGLVLTFLCFCLYKLVRILKSLF
jgi:hypothetical protein